MGLINDLENIVDGKNDATNFTAQLMRVVFKADKENKDRLRKVYPNLVGTVEAYQMTGARLNLLYDNEITGRIAHGSYLGSGIIILGDWNGRVYRSVDYCVTWVDFGVIASAGIEAIINLGNGIVTIEDKCRHIYRSTDYGFTWNEDKE